MVGKPKSIAMARTCFIACFILLVFVALALLLWISFSQFAAGTSTDLTFRKLLFAGMAIALVAYFKWPWLAAVVGWIDICMVLSGAFPWEEPGLMNFFTQFSFDIVFFVASQTGFAVYLVLKRSSAGLLSSQSAPQSK